MSGETSMQALAQDLLAIPRVQGLCEISSLVHPGDAFIACAKDPLQRAAHIDQGIRAGAAAVVIDALAEGLEAAPIPMVRIPNLAEQRGALAAEFYHHPTKTIECIGITGTNGKTSIAHHVTSLSEALGLPAGYIGTLGIGPLRQLTPSTMTTPSPVTLQRSLAEFHSAGLQRAALEISSHALDQDRAKDVALAVGVFSNLTRDHLDYHQSMERYAQAKSKLFSGWPLKLAVLNADDEMGRSLMACCRAEQVLSFGGAGDIRWRSTSVRQGMHALFDTPWGRLEAILPVAADFALSNVAAAISVLLGLGHSIEALAQALPKLQPVPGRMQVVAGDFGRPKVIVDFAHTPDAVAKVLAALAPQCRGKLICVLGCGGDRDRGKRPEMARVAAQGADQVWLTSDNPRNESPEQILQDMLAGLDTKAHAKTETVVDRGQAITKAIDQANADDIVLIAGKGHEQTQEIQGVKHAFNDVALVDALFKENA